MPEPAEIQQLENLGQDVLALMIRHDQLRPLINSIITEKTLDQIKLSEPEQLQAENIYRQRHNLNTAEDIKRHTKKTWIQQKTTRMASSATRKNSTQQ